ncbi:2-amino-3-ketobutyrate coenzyme A ligase, mitochondrial-like [Panonychus citri]|uniref:2-amino-3-ketobutyrate coenzyme A ligase, mitochondrial-like n=1 Tax=Panonychus citri TaxID=50023 RepID=UPI0023080EA1|nr:2-amino-3-ketobutyrate coenzyme A ligase, mitochondrial-like [Panonychus citri]
MIIRKIVTNFHQRLLSFPKTSNGLIRSGSCGLVDCRHNLHAWASVKSSLDSELETIKESGVYKTERIITSEQNSWINIEGKKEKVLNFCANNYLGLSSHPRVVQAGITALKDYGAGLSSVRFICGTQNIHRDLERKIAAFHGREDAILYASCFDANAGLFEVLLGEQDAIISDELNHASIIDGIRLCKAQRYRYKHRDMNDLRNHLESAKGSRRKLIATDGVFSMDGNVAPLGEIVSLAKEYGAMVFIDECHATGFFGSTGRGTEEFFNLNGSVDIINSTLGKALGGAAGGYTTGPKELIDLLRQRARPYLFSNSIPPPVVASASEVFDMLTENSDLPKKLASLTQSFRSQMKSAGFTILGDEHPICPVFLADAKLASTFADKMLDQGIYVIGFSYPVVPKGKARIRVQISASHTEEDINKAVNAFIETGKQLGCIN